MKAKRRIIDQDEMHVLFFPEVEFTPEELAEAERNGGVLRATQTVMVNGRTGRASPLVAYFIALFEAMGGPTRTQVEQAVAEAASWLAEHDAEHDPVRGWFVRRVQKIGSRYLTAETQRDAAQALRELMALDREWRTRQGLLPEIRAGRQRKALEAPGMVQLHNNRDDRKDERQDAVKRHSADGAAAHVVLKRVRDEGIITSLRSIYRDLEEIRGD
jgi:hypothetical protein